MIAEKQDPAAQTGTGNGHSLWLGALVVLAVAAWFMVVAAGHPWGDDWAGYLLQARALVDGTAATEVATNASAMRGGDVQVGPDAYPWGFPMLLAAVGVATDWDFESLKWVGLLSLVGVMVGAYALSRALVGPWLAALVAVLIALHPSLVVESAYLGSDLPFLAASTVALALVVRTFVAAGSKGTVSAPTVVALALLCLMAFSIRSNAVVLPATFVFALGVLAVGGSGRWRDAVVTGLGFALVLGLGTLLYFRLLPDGSLSSVSYISLDPAVWLQACVRHVNYIAAAVTFDLVRGPAKILPLVLFGALCLVGFLRRPGVASILAAYLAMHLALITIVPFDGGLRYYYPMLPALFMLLGLGLQDLVERARRRVAGRDGRWNGPAMQAASVLFLAMLVLALGSLVFREGVRHGGQGVGMPFSADTQEAFRYVSANAAPGSKIAFFKPRAFRLATGRLAVAIGRPDSLGRVDWYVFNKRAVDASTQLDEGFLADPASGFSLRREVGSYRIYARGPEAGKL